MKAHPKPGVAFRNEEKRESEMKKIITITTAATAVLTGCSLPMTDSNVHGTTRYSTQVGTAPSSAPPAVEAFPVNPYSSTGTWLVPEEIAPGTYRVNLAPGEDHGYGAVCGDYECDPFGEPGMLSNDNYFGPGVMVIPESAVSVELKRITLTPISADR